jgi:hypothetical protein
LRSGFSLHWVWFLVFWFGLLAIGIAITVLEVAYK